MASAKQSADGFEYPSVLEMTQEEFDRVFFGHVLGSNGQNIDVLRRLAELFARQDNYEQAKELDHRLAQLLPEDEVVRYNLACSLALTGHPKDAIRELEHAITLGYDDFARIESDGDLDSIRDDPMFQNLLKRYDP